MSVVPFRKSRPPRQKRARGLRPLGLRDLALTAGMFLILGALAVQFENRAAHEIVSDMRAIDGDTIDSSDGRIRLVGIDAPERDQVCTRPSGNYSCGTEARTALTRILDRRVVTCRTKRKDRYDRFLAVCTAGDLDINRAMVEAGWAVASGDYDLAEMRARTARRGIWAGEFDQPRDWRATHGLASESDGFAAAIMDRVRFTLHGW